VVSCRVLSTRVHSLAIQRRSGVALTQLCIRRVPPAERPRTCRKPLMHRFLENATDSQIPGNSMVKRFWSGPSADPSAPHPHRPSSWKLGEILQIIRVCFFFRILFSCIRLNPSLARVAGDFCTFFCAALKRRKVSSLSATPRHRPLLHDSH
jgi:hypothetical protein